MRNYDPEREQKRLFIVLGLVIVFLAFGALGTIGR